MTRGVSSEEAMSTLAQWAEYLAASGHAPSTIAVRRRTIEALARHAQVEDPILLTRGHVLTFLARPIKPWTKLTYWRGISRWSEFLREFDYVPDSNLVKGIPQPKTPPPVARPIDDETVSRLLNAPLSLRAYAYVRLALFEGLRVHEIAKIRGEHLDHAAGWLMITGKGNITAPIPIHPEIRQLAASMPEFGFWFPSHLDPSTSVRPTAVSGTIGAALRSIGSTATAHQLRDTAATRIQRQVKDIRITQTMLRHRSLQSTQKYCGVADESMRLAIGSLDWSTGRAA